MASSPRHSPIFPTPDVGILSLLLCSADSAILKTAILWLAISHFILVPLGRMVVLGALRIPDSVKIHRKEHREPDGQLASHCAGQR